MSDQRSDAAVRQHYEIERELADRLRNAPAGVRAQLYHEVYDELFRRVPDHPQLALAADPAESTRRVGHKLALLDRFVSDETTLVEVGAGDCALTVAVAPLVRRVIAVDVSDALVDRAVLPANVEFVLSDGTDIPVDPECADVAYSNQLMEHLHPDDAVAQVASIAGALRSGGRYVCITPSRLSGPHDVSRGFDLVATGLHLHEYSLAELTGVFADAGLEIEQCYAGGRGHYGRMPVGLARLVERAVGALPPNLRRRVGGTAPGKALLGLNLVARRV